MSQRLPTITRAQARQLDLRAEQEFGIPGCVLMENAGRGATDILCRLGVAGPVTIACGRGNNGGDGFVVARHLDLRGHAVRILLAADPARLTGDALLNYTIAQRSGLPIVRLDEYEPNELAGALAPHLAGASWIVDALLGTGAVGEVREPLATLIRELNGSGVPIFAIDLPSGLDCDTGRPAQATIRASHTCTFVAAKPGFFAAAAKPLVGTLHVTDIGAPRILLDGSAAQ